ncbi:MAG TPA: hypothetical protein VLH40_04010 [Atribacteraceae bacterium]|nr:hypothetical protein [Atribacteraceae bacterium]
MGIKRKLTAGILLIVLTLLVAALPGLARVDYDQIYQDTVGKWTRFERARGGTFSVNALYWSEEVVKAWVAKYGNENLLSAEEELAYHRTFLQRERLNRYLVFEVTLRKLKGAPLYPLQFARNTWLEDDRGNRYEPVEYPFAFEERIHDQATGKVYFRRFDDDGNPIVTPETQSLTLRFSRLTIDPQYIGEEIRLTWDNPYLPPDFERAEWRPVLEEEIIRLEERVMRLEADRRKLEEQQLSIEQMIEETKSQIRQLQDKL